MRADHRKQRQEDEIVEGETRVDEKLIRLFENDVLAPEDFIQVYRTRLFSPERKLMVAVLEEALIDYQRCANAYDNKKEMKRFAEAEAWILKRTQNGFFLSSTAVKHLVSPLTTCARDSCAGSTESVRDY